ncbi:MAG: sugar-binding protein [Armatimonadota bacterium]
MRHLFLVLLMLLSFPMTWAGELRKLPVQYLIPKVKAPVTIDGRLIEWDITRAQVYISPTSKDPRTFISSNDPLNPVKGEGDVSGRVALAWDEKYLYIATDMVDDHLLGIKPNSAGNQGPAPWACDSVMVSIFSYRQIMKTNSQTSTNPCIALRYAPTGQQPRGKLLPSPSGELDRTGAFWMITPQGKWAVTETPNGYSAEAAIPWSDLTFVPRSGERLFIGFLAPDMDPGEGLIQVGWGWANTVNAYPVFRLIDRENAVGILTPAMDDTPVNAPMSVRVDVDALKGSVKVDRLRVLNSLNKPVLVQPVKLEVPVGMTGSTTEQITAGALAPGRYTVQALLAGSGAVLASVPLRVTEAAPEPPAVANFPGELHHYRPARTAHTAYSNFRRGIYKYGYASGKDDYVPYIKKYVIPGVKETTRRLAAEKNRFMYSQLLHCLTAYRVTGDDEYVQLARDLMDAILTTGKVDSFSLFDIAAYRYFTWLQDPNSPFAPKDAEKRYRALFYPLAAGPSNEYMAETGTHNRVWHTYATLKVARLVAEQDGKPVAQRIKEYTDYHDTLIGEVGDSDDASSGYHWVWTPPALAIYFHNGNLKALADHKGYIKTFKRYVEMVSPSGGCPTFGSDGGWPQQGRTMWTYELLSALTRDGRYRWSAHRIAEYFYNHLYVDAGQYHGPFDQARENFSLAYLFADDSVKAVPPSPTSLVTWRHPLEPTPPDILRAHPGHAAMRLVPDRWLPDKLVLKSGNNPQDLWALVDLLPVSGHGGETPGNIAALMRNDSVLIAGQGYYEVTQQFQNLLWIEDLDGVPSDGRPQATEVPVLIEDPTFTFARIKTTAYQHLPVTYTRDILFYKNGFIVLKDKVKFESAMRVRLGPNVHTRDLGPQSGANWFNTYYDELYWTGLGLGRGVQFFQNPPWDLLVYFSPRPDYKQVVTDNYLENPYRLSCVRTRQVWSGLVRAGQELSFTTVLLPHMPTLTPKDLVEPPAGSDNPVYIQIARDDVQATVLKVCYDAAPSRKSPLATWILLNDTGAMVNAGPVESDGQLAIVQLALDGTTIQSRVLAGGTTLRYDNVDQATARKVKITPLVMPDWLTQ